MPWVTINGAHVLIDEAGNPVSGAGGALGSSAKTSETGRTPTSQLNRPGTSNIGKAKTLDEAVRHAKELGIGRVDLSPPEKDLFGEPLPETEALKNLNIVNAKLADLLDRYPDMPVKISRLVISDTIDGAATQRGSSRSLMVGVPTTPTAAQIGDIQKKDEWEGFTWNAARFDHWVEDSFTHELAHNLATSRTADDWYREMVRGGYGKDWVTKNISRYGSMNDREAISEAFSIYTRPDYKKGKLPSGVESVLESLLKGKK